MFARMWRGWTAADSADEVAAHLQREVVGRHTETAGNVSSVILRRSSGGGIELMSLSVWESPADLPPEVTENHRLFMARETIASAWEIVPASQPAVAAAA
jgi:hypothetical protein